VNVLKQSLGGKFWLLTDYWLLTNKLLSKQIEEGAIVLVARVIPFAVM
jgi:hypothetical protein